MSSIYDFRSAFDKAINEATGNKTDARGRVIKKDTVVHKRPIMGLYGLDERNYLIIKDSMELRIFSNGDTVKNTFWKNPRNK